MTRTPPLLVLGLAGAALVGGGWLLLTPASPGGAPAAGTGGQFSSAERDALGAAPVRAGTLPSGPDPAVDFTDPAAVARAYLVAGYSVSPTDAGGTNRRAVPYAEPGTPPGTIGVLVLVDLPVTASVTDLTQVGSAGPDTRREYLVGYRTAPGPDARKTRYLLLDRQADGRWLVAGDTPDSPIGIR